MVEFIAGVMMVVAMTIAASGIMWMFVEAKEEYKLIVDFKQNRIIKAHKA